MPLLLLDVDGTLIDSAPGIHQCLRRTLDHFAVPQPNDDWFRAGLGPGIDKTLASVGLGADAVEYYRELYRADGMAHSTVFPGIRELLDHWRAADYTLCTATNKARAAAEGILELHQLNQYFTIIGAADGNRTTKDAIIGNVLEQIGDVDDVVLVGDRSHDTIGAKAHGIDTVLVSWGYGNPTEWADATHVAHSVEELKGIIRDRWA